MKEAYTIVHVWNNSFEYDECFSEEVTLLNKEDADKICAKWNKQLEEKCSSKQTSNNVIMYLFDKGSITMEYFYVKKKIVFESEDDYIAYSNEHKLSDDELPM